MELDLALKRNLGQAVSKHLQAHHKLYRLPCFAEFLEEIISKSFKEIGYENSWEPNRSHLASTDITLDTKQTISIKSGEYSIKNKNLKFSGSRLGQYSTIEDKLNAVIAQSADLYICVSRSKNDWDPVPGDSEPKKYYLFIFDSEVLDYKKYNWEVSMTSSGNKDYVMQGNGINAAIRASMSHQLWTTVSLDLIGEPVLVEV
jgi:hypothetical protein